MERQVTFSTNMFGGFNKKSVLRYIDELCEQNESSVQELNAKIADLQSNNDGFTGTITQLGSELQTLRDTLQEETGKNSKCSSDAAETIKELNAELERQQHLIEDKDREIKIQQEKCRQLLLRAESLEYKGRKYDDSMAQIGEAIIEAQKSAAAIVKAAESKASRLTATTIESIHNLAGEIRTFKGDITMLRTTLQQSMAELEKRLDGIDSSLDTLDSAMKSTGVKADDNVSEVFNTIKPNDDIFECENDAKVVNFFDDSDEPEDFFSPSRRPQGAALQQDFTEAEQPAEAAEAVQDKHIEEKAAVKPREFFW
ncbi:MAG: hypothetical protein RR423_02125 [Hydrogenoanaerobacterium sp.]